jgi:hypothetical protein
MPYKDINPTYNVNRKVANFGDFTSNIDAEKEKLKKVKRSFTPNSDGQQFVRNSRTEYNPVTHKLTDYTEGEVEDKIKAIEELEGTNEDILELLKDKNISIDGEGEVKDLVIETIQKALRNIGGKVNLTVDGKEVDSRGQGTSRFM